MRGMGGQLAGGWVGEHAGDGGGERTREIGHPCTTTTSGREHFPLMPLQLERLDCVLSVRVLRCIW
jgi:hypothetical protein